MGYLSILIGIFLEIGMELEASQRKIRQWGEEF